MALSFKISQGSSCDKLETIGKDGRPVYFRNLTGITFGRLTVIKLSSSRSNSGFIQWECECICGKTCNVEGRFLTANNTKSCGCLVSDKARLKAIKSRLPRGEYGLNHLYHSYQRGAEKRKLQFGLTKDEFKSLTLSNCHYCNKVPSQSTDYSNVPRTTIEGAENRKFVYNGIDRVNNNVGYIVDNCVPCCKICNRAKLTMPYNEFLEWADAMSQFRINKFQLV